MDNMAIAAIASPIATITAVRIVPQFYFFRCTSTTIDDLILCDKRICVLYAECC